MEDGSQKPKAGIRISGKPICVPSIATFRLEYENDYDNDYDYDYEF